MLCNCHFGCFLQSRVGPVEWLKPYTDETIVELGQKGVKSLLAVPIRYYYCQVTIYGILNTRFSNSHSLRDLLSRHVAFSYILLFKV